MHQLPTAAVLGIGLASIVCTGTHLTAERHQIDPVASSVSVHVKKAGVFRSFGDDHEVRGPIKSGSIDDSPSAAVEIVIDASRLRVLDPNLSSSDRDQVQARMLGPDVLDVAHFPEIRFQSTSVARTPEGWRVTGRLMLHGQTRSMVIPVTNERGRYRGTASIKQTEFGIKPVSVAGGTVKVKDELSIDFDIQTRDTP